MMVPILEAVRDAQPNGMEVVSGIILGLDTDGPQTRPAILDFIEQSRIPMLTINLLQALPRTPLVGPAARSENRLIDDEGRESNVDFKRALRRTWSPTGGNAWRTPMSRRGFMPATSI